MKKQYSTLLISLFYFVAIQAQIRIEVVQHPEFLTSDKRLFIATNFNGWDAANPDFELKKDEKGVYFIYLPDTLTYFEYKFTQGAWALVEGSAKGFTRPNRIYEQEKELNPKLILVHIENWEKMPAYKFAIKSLPANTPHDASIYLTGNFNNWNTADPAYKMQKQGDGTYRLLVYSDLEKLEYKFTRGNWASVEGRESGKVRPNRIFAKTDFIGNNVKDIEVDILSWEDMSGRFNFFSLYDILMLFAALQGILFIIALTGIQNANRIANRWLLWIMGFIAIFILIRVLWQHRDFADTYPKITLLPDLIIFIYAPLFYFYLKKLLFQSEKLPYRWALHFIPSVLLFLSYMPYFLMENQEFKVKIVNQDKIMFMLFGIVGFIGFIFNMYYWGRSYKAIQHYKAAHQTRYSYEHNLQYLNTVLLIQAACLTLWLFTGGLLMFNRLFSSNFDYEIIEKCTDGVWLIFSTLTYFLGYYAIHQPEVFKMPHPELEVFEITPPHFTPIANNPPQYLSEKIEEKPAIEVKQVDENIMALAENVNNYLCKNRTFTNPNLSLNELAQKLKMQPHLLSKVINDGFNKNFFDFINSYRIEEFKKLAKDKRYKHHTFVSLAFEVGFNSKTAFNRSFKKMTNQTPREYLSLVQADSPLIHEK